MVVMGYLVVLHADLWRVYPLLAFLPAIAVGLVVYFALRSRDADIQARQIVQLNKDAADRLAKERALKEHNQRMVIANRGDDIQVLPLSESIKQSRSVPLLLPAPSTANCKDCSNSGSSNKSGSLLLAKGVTSSGEVEEGVAAAEVLMHINLQVQGDLGQQGGGDNGEHSK